MSRVKNLLKDFGSFRLEIPSLEIADEGVTAVWGPSGAGKTSLFRCLIGLEDCPEMKWIFRGEDLARLTPPDRHLGVVFQKLELFPHMTARQNIEFAALARGLSGAEFERRLGILREDLKLDSFLDRRASVLSGGEAQRVAISRAVITRPRFLFLDEPFSSLDADLRSDARALVKRVLEHFKIPTLMITHDEEDLRVLANHTVKVREGRVVG